MPSNFGLSPLLCCLGTSPSQAAKSRPLWKAAPLPMEATTAVIREPTPGISRSRRRASSWFAICSICSVRLSICISRCCHSCQSRTSSQLRRAVSFSYRVCLECGRQLEYSLVLMRLPKSGSGDYADRYYPRRIEVSTSSPNEHGTRWCVFLPDESQKDGGPNGTETCHLLSRGSLLSLTTLCGVNSWFHTTRRA